MTASRTIIRLSKAAALAFVLGALLVPAAQAGNRLVDDWFRDRNAYPATSIGMIDDSFRDATPAAAAPGDRIVDDYFRDATRVAAPTGPIVDDYFRDPQLAAPRASAPVADRIVDDYFRNPVRVVVPQPTSGGFDWGDFGIGAGAMLGLVLLLAGLTTAALGMRHRSGQLGTS